MINYEPFFQLLVVGLLTKDKKDANLTEPELRALISVLYRNAVRQVAEDTELYQLVVPVDLYAESRVYPISVPEGFRYIGVKSINTNGYQFNGRVDEQVLYLPCCPNRDIPKAWFLQVAVAPAFTSAQCEFDDDFVNRCFDAILAYIRYQLAQQDMQRWASMGKADYVLREYKQAVAKVRRGKFAVQLKQESLTDDSQTMYTSSGCRRC